MKRRGQCSCMHSLGNNYILTRLHVTVSNLLWYYTSLLTINHTLAGHDHQCSQCNRKGCTLSEAEQREASGRLQCCCLILCQCLVILISFIWFIVKILERRERAVAHESLYGRTKYSTCSFTSHPRQPILLWKMTALGVFCCLVFPGLVFLSILR